MATPQGFARNPAFVHEFYNARRVNLMQARPNAAHAALARLEAGHDGHVLIVTQNVDDLHEQAGSRNVLHMHGELLKIRCENCGTVHEWRQDLSTATPCPACGAPQYLRPHVVWFGEMPFCMDAIGRALDACDLFVSIGTSGNVYPAAGFVSEVRAASRAHTLELNLDPSDGASRFAERIHGPATEVVPAWVDRMLG